MGRIRIEYGSEPEQFGHLYLPGESDGGPLPVVLLLHGGYWSADFHLNLATAFAVELAKAGVASWNVEYRRIGAGGGWAETSADVEAALAAVGTLLPTHTELPLDPGNVRLLGHSAGAQLAVWLAGQRNSSIRPERVVSQAGALDLASRAATRRGGAVLEALFGADPQTYREASPLHRVPTGVPTLCLHGADDVQVPAATSKAYVEAARAAGDQAAYWEIPGEGHNDFLRRTSRSWALSLRAVLDPAPWLSF